MYLFSFVLLTAMTFRNNVLLGDPVSGVEVKLGKNPPCSTIATGVTDKNGTVEFKNLAPLTAGQSYEVEYGIKEQGIKAPEPQKVKITEQDLARQRTANSAPKVITQKVGDNEITVTCQDNWIRVKVVNGTINVSRSNIKQ